MGLKNSYDFQVYGVGKKRYGMAARSAPNLGPISGSGMQGYAERDTKVRMRRNALLRRMKAKQQGKFMSADWLRGQR